MVHKVELGHKFTVLYIKYADKIESCFEIKLFIHTLTQKLGIKKNNDNN